MPRDCIDSRLPDGKLRNVRRAVCPVPQQPDRASNGNAHAEGRAKSYAAGGKVLALRQSAARRARSAA